MDAELLWGIPGGGALVDWFDGRAPSFHDAEVLRLVLDREGERCDVRIHTFRMTPQTDATGHFICDRHVVVAFAFSGVTDLELDGFNHQNALLSLELSRNAAGQIRADLEPAYGLGGFVEAAVLQIDLLPGCPAGSIYEAVSP